MDPLTPNTSAFLSYLSSNLDDNSINTSYDSTANPTPASFPPSAFFPMPGRDTPEDTPPSSVEASQSPEKITDINRLRNDGAVASGSDLDGNESTGRVAKGKKATANHKRKATAGQHKTDAEDEDDEDSGSDSADVHEDKRPHQNKAGTKKGGRKSVGDDGKGGSKSDKAARRKEQNRAAQKAFRERREAKVKDLEDQLAELERKAYGTTVENENLRGILKRLQEENVALRQSAFTFSMPVNGSPTNGTGTNTPTQAAHKPPTPPHQNSADDVLRSIHDVPTVAPSQPQVPHRKSSSLNQDSPDSLVSVHSGNSGQSSTSGLNPATINLFHDPNNAFSAAALGGLGARQALPTRFDSSSSEATGTTSSAPSDIPSLSPGDRTELDALWASFLNPANKTQTPGNADGPSPFSLVNAQPQPATFAGNDAKIGTQTTSDWDKFAFRDATVAPAAEQAPPVQAQPAQQAPWLQQADPWAGMLDNGIDDFLASLSGVNNNAPQEKEQTDEDFNAQIQQILGDNLSPSDPFNLPANPFSPTNYLNMSPAGTSNPSNGPSPLSSLSNSASPESGTYSAPPVNADVMGGYSTIGPQKTESEHIYVVDEAGKVIKPSELWSNLEHLLIDDLCDMMRSKATCKDGKAYLAASDAEQMFRYPNSDAAHVKRLDAIAQRAGIADGAFSCPRK